MITSTAPAKPSPWESVNSGSSPAAGGRRRGRDARAPGAPSAHGTTIRLSSGAAAIATPAAFVAVEHADREQHAEHEARGRLHQHEPAVEAEAPLAGQEAAGEVARRVETRPRRRGTSRASRCPRRARPRSSSCSGSAIAMKQAAEPELDRGRDPQRVRRSSGRAPRARRSCARAAARRAGRSPTRSGTPPPTARAITP